MNKDIAPIPASPIPEASVKSYAQLHDSEIDVRLSVDNDSHTPAQTTALISGGGNTVSSRGPSTAVLVAIGSVGFIIFATLATIRRPRTTELDDDLDAKAGAIDDGYSHSDTLRGTMDCSTSQAAMA